MNSLSWRIDSEEQMLEFGRLLASVLPARALLLLSGNLGAGKTTLTKGIAEGLGAAAADEVSSPTFTLIHEYGDPPRLYHIDLYRIEEPRQLATLGLDEILDRDAVTVIEWPEKFLSFLPENHFFITLRHDGDSRIVSLTTPAGAPPLPAILSSASFPMDAHPSSVDTFALVAYLPEPLAAFLNDLRRRLDPGSEPNAHVTILPPRQLSGTPEEAQHLIHEFAVNIPSFDLELAGVRVFDCTSVIFLDLGVGRLNLCDLHNALNVGALAYPEPYPYHPHITLVQYQPAEAVSAVEEATRALWHAYPGPRYFRVRQLTFVKHLGGNQWLDLATFDLLG